jgi:hypothetical protein
MNRTFKGAAKKIDSVDLPKLASRIGCGEDEIHAFIDVETRGSGFDKQGRPMLLRERHYFYRLLKGAERVKAVQMGLANPTAGDYPKESYSWLAKAMQINETAALKSCSWGLGQIMGSNHAAAGYATVQDMVAAFCEDEEHQLSAAVNFIKFNKLDKALREHDWAAFARGYNGPAYRRNRYDVKLADAFAKWKRIPDTPWVDVVEPLPPVLGPEHDAPAAKPAPGSAGNGKAAAGGIVGALAVAAAWFYTQTCNWFGIWCL